MKEIGGYLELDKYNGEEYYTDGVPLNCGRNAIAYCIKLRRYKKVFIPNYCCKAVAEGVEKGGASYDKYDVEEDFSPVFSRHLSLNEGIIIVNYYGQLSNKRLREYGNRFGNVIVDNTQAFFQRPVSGVDTVYSCRKFFGVADGAYLITTIKPNDELKMDVSVERMNFVLGRFDVDAASYFNLACENNDRFEKVPIRHMSRLTQNLLCGLDYEGIANQRQQNFQYLHNHLEKINLIDDLICPQGGYMYPLRLQESVQVLRTCLIERKIYIPCLWPDVLENADKDSTAYKLADNILPLPCDQRYTVEDMKYMLNELKIVLDSVGVKL